MLRGIVKFRARIVDINRGVMFPLCEFNPHEPGVDKVEIEGPNGNEILTAIHLAAVATSDDGIAIATEVHAAALDRISFLNGIAIDNGDITDRQFSPINPTAGSILAEPRHMSFTGHKARFVFGYSAANLKTELERAAPPGKHGFTLFRSALLSTSPVEEFMHLYNILLMLFDDEQAGVDDFIIEQNPGVAKKERPPINRRRRRQRSLKEETVYTRLRNELGHKRTDVNLDTTKAEMKSCIQELRMLVKRAIELHS
jgi:hypothetical protein